MQRIVSLCTPGAIGIRVQPDRDRPIFNHQVGVTNIGNGGCAQVKWTIRCGHEIDSESLEVLSIRFLELEALREHGAIALALVECLARTFL